MAELCYRYCLLWAQKVNHPRILVKVKSTWDHLNYDFWRQSQEFAFFSSSSWETLKCIKGWESLRKNFSHAQQGFSALCLPIPHYRYSSHTEAQHKCHLLAIAARTCPKVGKILKSTLTAPCVSLSLCSPWGNSRSDLWEVDIVPTCPGKVHSVKARWLTASFPAPCLLPSKMPALQY